MMKKLILNFYIVFSLILITGCSDEKLNIYVNEPAVVIDLKLNKNEELNTVTVLLETGEKEEISVNNDNWILGEEVFLSTNEQEEKYELKPKIINENEKPKSNLILKLLEIEGLSDHELVTFDTDEIISSFSLQADKVEFACALMPSKQNDITSVLVIETSEGVDPAEFEYVFDEIIEGYKATYINNSNINSLLNDSYINYDNMKATLVIADKEVKEEIIKVCLDFE